MIVPYYYYSFRYIQHIRKYMKTTDVNIMSNLRIPVRLQRLIPHSLSTRISSKHLDYNQECQSESYESQTQDWILTTNPQTWERMKKNQGNREGDTILVKSYKFKENLKLLFEEERKEKRKMMLLELVAADRPSISDGLKRSDRWKKQTVRILGTTRNPESYAHFLFVVLLSLIQLLYPSGWPAPSST